jgi:hypothetical protein
MQEDCPMRNEKKWLGNYTKLKAYIEEHGQLPDKKKEENRNLLNWWKYNRRLTKQGKISSERAKMLAELSRARKYHLPID